MIPAEVIKRPKLQLKATAKQQIDRVELQEMAHKINTALGEVNQLRVDLKEQTRKLDKKLFEVQDELVSFLEAINY